MNRKIIQQEEISYIAVGYELTGVSYSNVDKICKAKLNIISENGQKYDYPEIILWQENEYDLIGQFTDEDVNHRILELIG